MWTSMATPEMFMNSTKSSVAAAWNSRNCLNYGYTNANGKKMFDGSADYGCATIPFKNTNNILRKPVQTDAHTATYLPNGITL